MAPFFAFCESGVCETVMHLSWFEMVSVVQTPHLCKYGAESVSAVVSQRQSTSVNGEPTQSQVHLARFGCEAYLCNDRGQLRTRHFAAFAGEKLESRQHHLLQ